MGCQKVSSTLTLCQTGTPTPETAFIRLSAPEMHFYSLNSIFSLNVAGECIQLVTPLYQYPVNHQEFIFSRLRTGKTVMLLAMFSLQRKVLVLFVRMLLARNLRGRCRVIFLSTQKNGSTV